MNAKGRFYSEVFLIAFAALLLEISYTRIFSHKFLYFFTYLAIGISLLGLGSGGVAVAVSRRLRAVPLERLFVAVSLAGSMAIVAGYLIIAPTGVDTLHLTQSYFEPAKLVLVSALLFAPFWCIGTLLSAVFSARTEDANRLYCVDLIGASLGCIVAVPLISTITPPGCVMLAGAALALASVRTTLSQGVRKAITPVLLVIILVAVAMKSDILPDPRSVKGEVSGGQTTATYVPRFTGWGPIFRVDAVEVQNVPKPGIVLFHDGLTGSGIVKSGGDPKALTFLGTEPAAIPFAAAVPSPNVLIIGAAGGHEINTSLFHDARHVTGVELNPVTHHIVTHEFADYAGRFHENPKVDYINGEGRSFLARDTNRYDLVYFVAPDSYSATNAASASAFVLSESYLYTVEMVRQSLEHLTESGLIGMQFGEFAYEARPNRTIRYLLTAREAFRQLGITDFEKHVVVTTVKGFINESFIVINRAPFTAEQVARIKTKLAEIEGGRLRYAPGEPMEDAPVTAAITKPDDALFLWLAKSPYELGPVTDNAPFFWHFVPFTDILLGSVLISAETVHYDPEEGLGERVLLFTVAFCGVFAFIALVLPFILVRNTWSKLPRKGAASIYFACLGLGFMAYEICLIQKFTLFLGYPTYSLTVTLMTMLVFAGIGSMWSGTFRNASRTMLVLLGTIAVMTLIYQFAATPIFAAALHLPLAARIALTIALLAPLSLCLGAFMPLGMRAVSSLTDHGAEYVAWGWAINGFFSVISSLLTTLVSMAYGFQRVLFLALCLYGIAVLLFLRLSAPARGQSAP